MHKYPVLYTPGTDDAIKRLAAIAAKFRAKEAGDDTKVHVYEEVLLDSVRVSSKRHVRVSDVMVQLQEAEGDAFSLNDFNKACENVGQMLETDPKIHDSGFVVLSQH